MHKSSKILIGNHAEEKALAFLNKKGYILVARNYRCFNGEIDLIMRDRDDIVFIEVRSRSRSDYGRAGETVTRAKQAKLIKAATLFLQKKGWLYKVNSRFDVIAIHYIDGECELEWFKNAFQTEN